MSGSPEPRGAVLVVAAGGVLGVLTRHAIAQAWPAGGGVPWPTLLINIIGSLALGALLVVLGERTHRWWVRPFLGPGILGGFTTFSAVAGETLVLLDEGQTSLALAYWAGSAVLAVAAAIVGVRTARWVVR